MKKGSYDGPNLVGPSGNSYARWRAARDNAIAKPRRASKKLPGMPKHTPRSRKAGGLSR